MPKPEEACEAADSEEDSTEDSLLGLSEAALAGKGEEEEEEEESNDEFAQFNKENDWDPSETDEEEEEEEDESNDEFPQFNKENDWDASEKDEEDEEEELRPDPGLQFVNQCAGSGSSLDP